MKQTQFDKHNIAWFKIAECVSRGEKERALGVYRLLSHSFNDNAIASQLEADIYSAFGEIEQAISLYQQAMESYKKSHRFLKAAAVGEHLVTMQQDNMSLHRGMVQLYVSLGMALKVRAHVQQLIGLLAQKQLWYEIKNVLLECVAFSDENDRALIYADIIQNAYALGCPWDVVVQNIDQAIDNLVAAENNASVQEFISALQDSSDKLHEYAVVYLNK